jgi:hypothetical protein
MRYLVPGRGSLPTRSATPPPPSSSVRHAPDAVSP